MEQQNRSILKRCLTVMAAGALIMVGAQALRWPPDGTLEVVDALFVVVSVLVLAAPVIRHARAGLWSRERTTWLSARSGPVAGRHARHHHMVCPVAAARSSRPDPFQDMAQRRCAVERRSVVVVGRAPSG